MLEFKKTVSEARKGVRLLIFPALKQIPFRKILSKMGFNIAF
jgi:hypothetical protein